MPRPTSDRVEPRTLAANEARIERRYPLKSLPRLGEMLAAPRFTSIRYGDPGYGQLAFDCSETIRRGASNGGEIGAFALTDAPRREAAIDGCLKEYLPYGMGVKVFYVT